MGDVTLDISEVQIVVAYPGDAGGFSWHHRILLHRIEGAVWLRLTPDHEIQRHDLANQAHRILDGASEFPADIAAEIYAHDPNGKASLTNFKRQALVQAAILGDGSPGESESFVWLVSEASRPDFGSEVDQQLLRNGATGLSFTSKGVIIKDGEEVFVERVARGEIQTWRKTKGLEGADVRVLGDFKDSSGKKRLDLISAVPLMKDLKLDDFPIQGTRAAKEFHEAVAHNTQSLLVYRSEWLRQSGVPKKSSAAHVHRAICEGLRLAHTYDQLDLSCCAL